MSKYIILIILFSLLCTTLQRENKNLYKLNISQDITVSGVSAGAFFAVQMGVIYSSIIKGVGSFAGGPYYCAQDLEMDAFMYCMYDTMPLDVSTLESYTSQQVSSGNIDSTSNLKSQNVWIFSGTLDTVVNPKSSKYLIEQYQNYGVSPISVLDIPAEHSWVTNNFGNDCSTLGSPYINDCSQLDAIKQMLTTIYKGIKTLASPISQVDANLFTFDQSSYGGKSMSFAEEGYVYIPSACQAGKQCALHIAFHGCEQQSNKIGTTFVKHSQLNGYAEANDIVIIYPQLVASYFEPSNPEGCFDWWGYTNPQFATNQGPQPKAIRQMIQTVAGF